MQAQHAKHGAHFIRRNDVAWFIGVHLIIEAYCTNISSPRNNISPLITTPRCEDYRPSFTLIGTGDELFKLAPADLEQKFRVLSEPSDDFLPSHGNSLDKDTFLCRIAGKNNGSLEENLGIEWWGRPTHHSITRSLSRIEVLLPVRLKHTLHPTQISLGDGHIR